MNRDCWKSQGQKRSLSCQRRISKTLSQSVAHLPPQWSEPNTPFAPERRAQRAREYAIAVFEILINCYHFRGGTSWRRRVSSGTATHEHAASGSRNRSQEHKRLVGSSNLTDRARNRPVGFSGIGKHCERGLDGSGLIDQYGLWTQRVRHRAPMVSDLRKQCLRSWKGSEEKFERRKRWIRRTRLGG